MTSFSPEAFLNTTFEGSNDTKVIPCPASEYLAISDKVEVKAWSSKDGSSSGLKLVILWDIQDDNVKALTGRDKVTVPQDIMLDLTEEGGLDMGTGKNIGLGRVREATDTNQPGQPFSFPMLQGKTAKVIVSHRVVGEDPYAEIKKVAKPA